MSAGMDALAIQRTLANGKPRTHSELIIAVGFGGARMRAAIALLARDGQIVSDPMMISLGSAKGEHKAGAHPNARRALGSRSVNCWRAP